jgi:hypothetical protein
MRFRSRSAAASYSANQRWRVAEARAEAERESGTPDRKPMTDAREPFELDLRSAGWKRLRIEPRLGYVAWRAINADTGEVLHCAAIKELLRWIAGKIPRQLGSRNFH